jgi:excisionase family DNA binding protein
MLTVNEVATRLRVSPESVRRWARQGRLRAVKVGRQLRIPPTEVERILSAGLDSPWRAEAPPDDELPRYEAQREPARRTPRIIG